LVRVTSCSTPPCVRPKTRVLPRSTRPHLRNPHLDADNPCKSSRSPDRTLSLSDSGCKCLRIHALLFPRTRVLRRSAESSTRLSSGPRGFVFPRLFQSGLSLRQFLLRSSSSRVLLARFFLESSCGFLFSGRIPFGSALLILVLFLGHTRSLPPGTCVLRTNESRSIARKPTATATSSFGQ